MADSPLIVPMDLDALVVNSGVAARDTFQVWPFNYISLNHFKSPEPEGVSRLPAARQPGIYLHWTLPRGLRRSSPPAMGADIGYPPVPNRWLVARVTGGASRKATAWVVESDCPYTSKVTWAQSTGSSLYMPDQETMAAWKASTDAFRNGAGLNPNATTLQTALLGVAFPLSQGWTERAPDPMFLTAVAPANAVFSIYTAHNNGIFSFYDDLHGIDTDTISYTVIGWYSNPARDILASSPTPTPSLKGRESIPHPNPLLGKEREPDSASQDPKAAAAYQNLISWLQWQAVGADRDPTIQVPAASISLYQGMSLSIPWSRAGAAPSLDPLQAIRDGGKLNVAIGNTTIDALSALISQQMKSPQDAALLQAFQYDFLSTLNQVNGEALLEEKVRQEWFGSKGGGTTWTIVPVSSELGVPQDLAPAESAWLLALNKDQAALDDALNTLWDLQWHVQALWYKQGFLNANVNSPDDAPDGIDPNNLEHFKSQLASELNPNNANSSASKLVVQMRTVKASMANVPQPDYTGATTAQQAFQSGIQAFATSKNLDPQKTLKAVNAERFWQANNPVMLISGVDPSPAADPDAVAVVRTVDMLVTGLTAGGKEINVTTAASAIPSFGDVSGLPAQIPALLTEFVLVDPANATAFAGAAGAAVADVAAAMTAHKAADYHGTLPTVNLAPWSQPWCPMFCEWRANYVAIPFSSDAGPYWKFDGTDYHFTDKNGAPSVDAQIVAGMSLLSAHAQFIFGSRLDKFVKSFGTDNELAKIDAWMQQVYQWKFLAQEMTGFNTLLSLRDSRAYRRPSPFDNLGGAPDAVALADITGYNSGSDPHQLPDSLTGRVNTVPYLPNGPALPFHGTRQGQFYFTDLLLYDKFGRSLWVIESATGSGLYNDKNFPVIIDAPLAPDVKIDSTITSIVQVPPRTLQYSRLEVAFLDGLDDTAVLNFAPNVNPVAAWVLPNHLDNGLLLYAPDGTSLGEYRLSETAQGTKAGEWIAPAHSTVRSLDDVGKLTPHLKQMLSSTVLGQQANFLAFLAAIDETLWTTDPIGNRVDQNLSVLIGRPLALVRARLQFQLDGAALTDTGWANTFAPPSPDFLRTPFQIRLGDQATRQDGVIGYYVGADYDSFNSVAAPAIEGQTYLSLIGAAGAGGSANYIPLTFADNDYAYVTLLVDPRGSISATTGIVPVYKTTIPTEFVQAPLSNLEISFRLGSVLTNLSKTPPPGSFPLSIGYPVPTEQNGEWSWWETNASGVWTGYDLINANSNAQLSGIPNTVRDGVLQFIVNLNKRL